MGTCLQTYHDRGRKQTRRPALRLSLLMAASIVRAGVTLAMRMHADTCSPGVHLPEVRHVDSDKAGESRPSSALSPTHPFGARPDTAVNCKRRDQVLPP